MSRKGGMMIVAVVVVAVALGTTVWQTWPHDSVRRVPVSEAVAEFQREMKHEGRYNRQPSSAIPSFGVYRYATRGSESIDTSAASTGHNYDGTSTITLTPSRCGITERWQALAERWIETHLCLSSHGARVAKMTEFHEFFDHPQSTQYECDGGTSPPTPNLRAGIHWMTTCSSENGMARTESQVVGPESLWVAGQQIPAMHLSSSTVLKGDSDGTVEGDVWLRRSDGLLLRRTSSSTVHINIADGGQFNERYMLDLLSLRAQR